MSDISSWGLTSNYVYTRNKGPDGSRLSPPLERCTPRQFVAEYPEYSGLFNRGLAHIEDEPQLESSMNFRSSKKRSAPNSNDISKSGSNSMRTTDDQSCSSVAKRAKTSSSSNFQNILNRDFIALLCGFLAVEDIFCCRRVSREVGNYISYHIFSDLRLARYSLAEYRDWVMCQRVFKRRKTELISEGTERHCPNGPFCDQRRNSKKICQFDHPWPIERDEEFHDRYRALCESYEIEVAKLSESMELAVLELEAKIGDIHNAWCNENWNEAELNWMLLQGCSSFSLVPTTLPSPT